MPSERKIKLVRSLRASLLDAECVVVIEHFGINAAEMTALRKRLAPRGWRLCLAANTLARRALRETPASALAPLLSGSSALLIAPAEGRAALSAIVDHIRRSVPESRAAAWQRHLADPAAARLRWLREVRSGGYHNWSAYKKPGALLRVRGAWLEGQVLSAEEARVEADLSPEVVYRQLLHTLQAPARQLFATLQAGPTSLTRLLAQVPGAQR